ncbi:MAG: MotA/TolQ/ExbB proton channel family protein, partial [Bdellovibrionaceae bacterium]|nr:MotA/TolQ/ExbB proton channel family protein [Pseudobdellovibrionaceae bacterium]
PPALGMVGTVIGMVSLFQSLDGNKQSIGPSLALAMTATFLGLVLANALVMPLADRLQLKHTQEKQHLTHIYQILLLIGQNEPQNLVEDEVAKRAG